MAAGSAPPPPAERVATVVSAAWAGVLVCIAAVGAPAAFATLPAPEAGRLMGRVFAVEAWLSLILAALLFVFGRLRLRGSGVAASGPVFGARSILLAGTVGCTLVGYFAIQPLLPGARAGQGPWSFGMLHAASSAFFALKMILVVVLAWRASGG